MPYNRSIASVPSSIKSIFVTTPIVLSPSGSTSLASWRASEFARSVFAAVKAKINAFYGSIYLYVNFLIWTSMSWGWPFTGTFVIPGKSTRVKSTNLLEYIVRLIGSVHMFLFKPANLFVWALISFLISSKLKNFSPFLWRNSPYS